MAYLGPAGGCGQEFAAHFAIAAGWDVEASGGRHGNSFRCHTWHTCVGDLVWTEISTVHRFFWVFRNSGCVHVVEVLPDAQQAGARPWGFPRGFSVLALDVIKPWMEIIWKSYGNHMEILKSYFHMISIGFPYDFHMIFQGAKQGIALCGVVHQAGNSRQWPNWEKSIDEWPVH